MLRTSLSLSAVLQEPVRITDIRAGRPNPGLASQHVSSIEAVARLCDAEVDGLAIGSREVEFRPGALTGGEFEFDIGTAGSIALVLQACVLPGALSKAPVSIIIKGGTDVKWSPPMDFIGLVYLPLLARFDIHCDMEIVARGFYPEGGGEVHLSVDRASTLKGFSAAETGSLVRISGTVFCQNLPGHVATRLKHAALKNLIGFPEVRISSEERSGRSTGAGIVLAAEFRNTVLGESALGQRGVKAEALGEACATDLSETIQSGATVDPHALDQLLPFMAMAEGESLVLAEELTGHAETNIWAIERFLGPRFRVQNRGDLTEIWAD